MEEEPHGHRLVHTDEADRQHRPKRVPIVLALAIATFVLLVLAYFDMRGIER